MKKILITGASGFVGGHLVVQAKKKYEVHALLNKNQVHINNIQTYRFDLSRVDQINRLLNKISPDVVIHTAAIANPDLCEADPDLATMVNAKATEQLARWAEKNNVRFIFTSTDMVFDGKKGNYKESDLPNPISFYSNTKVAAEKIITKNNSNYVIARVALVYGIGITRHTCFFETMLEKLKKGDTITLFYDQFRSPILVDNLAEALLELAENKFIGTIHLGGSERISRWEFGLKTCEIFDFSLQTIIKGSMFDFEGAAFRPQDISFDIALAKQILKMRLLNCDEGLGRIINNYKL